VLLLEKMRCHIKNPPVCVIIRWTFLANIAFFRGLPFSRLLLNSIIHRHSIISICRGGRKRGWISYTVSWIFTWIPIWIPESQGKSQIDGIKHAVSWIFTWISSWIRLNPKWIPYAFPRRFGLLVFVAVITTMANGHRPWRHVVF